MFSGFKLAKQKGKEEVYCYRSVKSKPPRTPSLSRKQQRRDPLDGKPSPISRAKQACKEHILQHVALCPST
ncbi:jg177 [Pararge aegeria aegeria]|uniref:Jg177 protein n=1 Tax=Pararge aegeria aegeria TaxID=348720 RepID=A0A8S4QNX1_9NEOP|nr:jg177 [Pararge aegeria aegeria]